MFNPTKRLGDDEEGSGHAVIAVGIPVHKPGKFAPDKRLGDPEPDEDAGPAGDPDELMDAAAEGICTKLNVSTKAAPALKQYLEAFFRAADSKPHPEGDDEDDDTEEN